MQLIALEIAGSLSGTLHKAANVPRRGVFIVPDNKEGLRTSTTDAITALLMVHTEKRYFPVGLQDIESGPIAIDALEDSERDFPRMLTSQLFQYPLLAGFAIGKTGEGIYVLSSPYFLLVRHLLSGLKPGKLYSSTLTLDVEEAFRTLKGLALPQGEIFVKSGRMVITGIEYIRTAEFSGDNVIASPLYIELRKRPGVTVHPKACRLGRKYAEPVGGNRRPFVCWFDQLGNFRFSPGGDALSTMQKFIELLGVLTDQRLVVDAETLGPPVKTS
jgi:hypothetical protein